MLVSRLTRQKDAAIPDVIHSEASKPRVSPRTPTQESDAKYRLNAESGAEPTC